ncbi:MAG TPA: ATP-binding protein [Ignavibacteria bacterium]|nr:ATP-binding protein [Ignavibacteria bacterium]
MQPEYFLLQKTLAGGKFSVLKNVGFYTYYIIYAPITVPGGKVIGVCLTSELIDIKFQLKNQFFPDFGLTQEISENMNVSADLITANSISGKIEYDSIKYSGYIPVDIIGLNDVQIGKLFISSFEKEQYVQNITEFKNKYVSVLAFFLAFIVITITILLLNKIQNKSIQIFIFALVMILIRYFLLWMGFPSKSFDSDIFSPSFYASPFGFGILKSIGALFLTSICLLIICAYSVIIQYRYKVAEPIIEEQRIWFRNVKIAVYLAGFFFVLEALGLIIKVIISDSNLNFFDRSQIIPDKELFLVQLSILFISFSLITFLVQIAFAFRNIVLFSDKEFFKRYNIITFLIVFLIVNQLIEWFIPSFDLEYYQRIFLIVSIFLFVFYIKKNLLLKPDYRVLNLKTFSIFILICIVIVPFIIITKITSQETRYVEIIAQKLAEDEDERINFTISNELMNLSSLTRFENDLNDKNLLPKLAFYLWAESKLNSEDFNSAVVILDTNRKILSDFNINDAKLNTNDIITFLNKNFFEKGYNISLQQIYKNLDTLEISDTANIIDEMGLSDETLVLDSLNEEQSPVIIENIAILKNPEEKFYVGIAPIEKQDLKGTPFARILGYLVITIHSESRNFLLQTSAELFKNYNRSNILNKLISDPVLTEYVNGEIISSTDPDVSKSTVNSLSIFKEYLKNSETKSVWRMETINDEKYRTFYILSSNFENVSENENTNGNGEKVYSVSIKRDDFKVITFFYLKFILFTLIIFLALYFILAIYYLLKNKSFRLNFREKLFVSFLIVSVIPIVFLAIYTRSFIIDKNDVDQKNQIVSDLNLLNESLKGINFTLSFISNQDSLKTIQKEFINRNISQFDKNFNLYLKNRLVSTTNEELYKSDLLDTRVSAEAAYNLIYLKKDLFLDNQDIGRFSYLVGYKPLRDARNNLVGIISSQLVYRQNEINEELTETLTFIFGIYFIVIIILLIVVSFLTEKISSPILALRNATEKVSKGDINVAIDINRNDELGDLVRSFNIMTVELEKSRAELKKAEREEAWRDIARRVAHEIKNPLTPMKLSIQYLAEIYKSGDQKTFHEVLYKTKKMISNEIDKLNRIATEFSYFAKLPKRNYEPLYANEVLEDVISLYSNHPNIKFKIELNDSDTKIVADKQELNRIFQNLIKNSIQAIIKKGVIEINSVRIDGKFKIEIADDGIGMDKDTQKKLFEPNFSTKSSGMGLGLAITKKSLDDMKAKIKFESKLGEGTKVILEFKTYKN